MPKMRGLLHSRPKIDEAELALAQARVAARLADLFGAGAEAPAETPPAGDTSSDAVEEGHEAEAGLTPYSAPAGPGPWPGGPRPPIVVKGDADAAGVETESDQVELVGVMDRSGDDAVHDSWERFLADATQLTLDPGLRAAAAAEEAAVATSAEPSAPAPVDPVPAAVEHRTTPPTGPSPRGSSRDRPGRSAAGHTTAGHTTATRSAATRSAATRSAAGPSPAGRSPVARSAARRSAARRSPAGRSAAARTTRAKAPSVPVPAAFCPYCALLLQPPPVSSRRCARCRQRIIVKRVEGRAVYLTEAAVLVFEAERRRVATSGRLARERERWLRLAVAAGAPTERHARLAAAPLSQEVVGAARTLYLGTVDRAFRAAKRDHEWETASRIRREQAAALYRLAGSPLPPPAELVALFREGVVAELRGIAEIARDAELVSASCCDVCRADDRRIFRIAQELRMPRLPHELCPRGLCRCGWDLAARDRTTVRRLLRRRPRTESRTAPTEPAPTA